jgi:hypothetical protein
MNVLDKEKKLFPLLGMEPRIVHPAGIRVDIDNLQM